MYTRGVKPTSERIGDVLPGWWYSFCCEEDLYQLKTVDDISDLLQEYTDDDDGVMVDLHFWPTRQDALADLCQG